MNQVEYFFLFVRFGVKYPLMLFPAYNLFFFSVVSNACLPKFGTMKFTGPGPFQLPFELIIPIKMLCSAAAFDEMIGFVYKSLQFAWFNMSTWRSLARL